MVSEDSIIFNVNNVQQKVRILAWGQDFVMIKANHIQTSVWTKDRPYLVYNEALVDSGQTLTIEPGTTVYFHKNAGLKVKGTLKVLGTFGEPVEFVALELLFELALGSRLSIEFRCLVKSKPVILS